MDYTLEMRTDIIYDEEKTPFTVYGVNAIGVDGRVAEFPDIAFDPAPVRRFMDSCAREQIPWSYLEEAVCRTIEEQYAGKVERYI